jgi:hypothetical protein|nr:hypothetical protein [Kofleriaceae bacterium]
MDRRRLALFGLPAALALACGGHGKAEPASHASPELDALWRLAPAQLTLGIVGTAHAADELIGSYDALHAVLATPELAPLGDALARSSPLLAAPPAKLGLGARPFAYFATADDTIYILPVVDRDAFVAAMSGTRGSGADADTFGPMRCRSIDAYYACAKQDADLDALLARSAAPPPPVDALDVRGDLEIAMPAARLALGSGELVAAALLERGTADVHVVVTGAPRGRLAALAALHPLPPPAAGAAGFAVADLSPLMADAPATPLVPGATAADLVRSLKGPVAIAMPGNAFDLQLHAPLIDPKPFTALLARCSDLGTLAPELQLSPKLAADGACRVDIPGAANLALEVWLEGNELRAGAQRGSAVAGAAVPLTAVGHDLASGDWQYAAWGRGSLLAPADVAYTATMGTPPTLRLFSLIAEAGAGVRVAADGIHARVYVRTIFANPPDVAQKLLAIGADDLAANRAGTLATGIAAGAPQSPFATDIRAGQNGVMLPLALGFIVAQEYGSFAK